MPTGVGTMLRGGHHGSGVGTMAKSGPNNNNTNPSGVCTINQISVNTVNKACASNPAQTHSGVGTAANSASTMPKAKDGTYLAVNLFKRNAGTAPTFWMAVSVTPPSLALCLTEILPASSCATPLGTSQTK